MSLVPLSERESLEGHAAGVVTRACAFFIDVVVIAVTFALAEMVVERLVGLFLGKEINVADSRLPGSIALVLWTFLYAAYPLAVAGRTLGMAIVGLQATQRDGSELTPRAAIIRVLVFPLSFLLMGFGFLLIVLRRDHRALHDLIAGSAVVYAWQARPAHLAFLARTPA